MRYTGTMHAIGPDFALRWTRFALLAAFFFVVFVLALAWRYMPRKGSSRRNGRAATRVVLLVAGLAALMKLSVLNDLLELEHGGIVGVYLFNIAAVLILVLASYRVVRSRGRTGDGVA